MDAVALAGKLNKALGKGAAILGAPFVVYRPATPWVPPGQVIRTITASFTNAKSSGYSFTKSIGFDDILWHGLFDGSQTSVGDLLEGARTYFIAAQEPLLPIMCVLCNRTVTITRPGSELSTSGGQGQGLSSQGSGTGRYWGPSQTVAASGAGESGIVSNVPCATTATSGKATGTGEVPSDAPGPTRWRFYLPISICPEGSIKDRDIVTDEAGARHQVTAADWTAIGYKLEAIRLEN